MHQTTQEAKRPEIMGVSSVETASGRVDKIMRDLIQCESGGNPKAINPYDLDKTASYGILQFKPQTLYSQFPSKEI